MVVRAGGAVGLAFALLASSCTPPAPGRPAASASAQVASGLAHLRLIEAEDAQTLDPALVNDPTSLAIGSEIFEGLTRLDAGLRPAPGLADRWEIADAGRTYTFHLRPAHYQSGSAVRAQDAVAAWSRALAPGTASPLTTFFQPLGASHPGDALSSVEAVDSQTLRVRLPVADSALLTLMALPPYWLTDPQHPDSGSGPYRLGRWDRGRGLQLSANSTYWGAHGSVRTVDIEVEPDAGKRLDRFVAGSVDVAHGFTGSQLLGFARDPERSAELHKVPTGRSTYLGFNVIAGSGYGPPERMAIALAIDRSRLTDLALFGSTLAVPATDLIPPGIPGHLARTLPPYDPAAAKRALDLTGFAGPIDLYSSTNSTVRRVGLDLQDQLTTATGRTVTLHPISDLFRRASLDQLPVFIDTWTADFPYPSDVLESLLRTGAQFNNLGLSDAHVDAALDQGKNSTSFDAAVKSYQQAEAIVIDDNRLIPLYSGVEPYLVQRGITVPFTRGATAYRWEEVH
ncbi:MAG: peptide ABC transporter substrate-binding protein [Candidatus Dormibacteraeota bacterium]|nr:peptide ABC transporter substrate-binding protein [Candidatus Dormibacteraeota bacterium]